MIYQTCKAFPLSSCNTYLKEYNFEELKNISNAVKNNLNIYQKSPTTSVEQQFKLANLDLTSCFMDLSITTPKLLQSVLGQFDNILHSTIKSIFPGDDPIETIQKDFSMLLKINQQLGMPDPILNNCPQSFPS